MGQFVNLTSQDGFVVPAWVAQPDGAPRGAVVVLQEIFGVNSHIRAVADRFAARGYLAVAPATFARVQPDVDLGYSEADMGVGFGLKTAVEALPGAGAMPDIQATIALLEELMPHDIGVSVSYPLPGTKFYERVRSLLGDKQNWTDSDDLAMMYPATFSQAYYRRLHRLVHKRFRLRQGQAELRQLLRTGRGNLRRALRTLYYAPAAAVDAWRLERLAE